MKKADFASAAGVSLITVTLWQSGKAMPTLSALQSLRTVIEFDLNALARIHRSNEEVELRHLDRVRLQRVLERLDTVPYNPEVPMYATTRALIARAIMTCPESAEDELFGILTTKDHPTRFCGSDWVRLLYEGYALENEQATSMTLSFAERIKRLRQRVGLTGNAFSAVLGLPQATLVTWESGRAAQLVNFAAAFGRLDVDLNWFVTEPSSYIDAFSTDFDWREMLT